MCMLSTHVSILTHAYIQGNLMISGSKDNSVRFWDIVSGLLVNRCLCILYSCFTTALLHVYLSHRTLGGWTLCLVFSSTGALILVKYSDPAQYSSLSLYIPLYTSIALSLSLFGHCVWSSRQQVSVHILHVSIYLHILSSVCYIACVYLSTHIVFSSTGVSATTETLYCMCLSITINIVSLYLHIFRHMQYSVYVSTHI
jgi:WD40 repeat protein